ncbi:hypothetical protein SeLEV6574_g08131, partial [Synchytrium endobioticum]
DKARLGRQSSASTRSNDAAKVLKEPSTPPASSSSLEFLPNLQSEYPLASYVNVLIGVAKDGNVFPGPARPYGYAKPGVDIDRTTTNEPNNTPGGYRVDGLVEHITLMHAAGSGDVGSWKTISILPAVNFNASTYWEGNNRLPNTARNNERVILGYYDAVLNTTQTRVEIASTERSVMFRYTWPRTEKVAVVVNFAGGSAPSPMGGDVAVEASRLTGCGKFRDGWTTGGLLNNRGYFSVCVCAGAEGAESTVIKTLNEESHFPQTLQERSAQSRPFGYFEMDVYKNQQTHLRVGISLRDIKTACSNLDNEMPLHVSFEDVVEETYKKWEEALAPIKLLKASPYQKAMVYSSFYRAQLTPTNRTGDNPKWVNEEFYFDDEFCIWDTFRATMPLLLFLRPTVHSQVLRALADIGVHDGYIPDCRVADSNGRTQVGSNGVVPFADAAVKGFGADGLDWHTVFKVMVRDAEVPPTDWLYEGRGDIKAWNELGYIPAFLGQADWYHRSCARTLEYSYNDYSIAQVALKVNNSQDYSKYSFRSLNWRNLWDDSIESSGVKGFIAPRGPDGEWVPAFRDPVECSLRKPGPSCTLWNAEFYEASSWTYSFYTPHDMTGLVTLCGGPEEFVKRLDVFFDEPGLFDIGNEPAFLIPYLYNYAGRPDKTAERVRYILAHNFSTEIDGLPGNDDAGSMAAWVLFGMIGIFPVVAQDVYLIGSPQIPEIQLRPDNSKTTGVDVITHHASDKNIYVQRVSLNGKSLSRNWIRHTEILQVNKINRLEFWMGETKNNDWGLGSPPSSRAPDDYVVYGKRQVAPMNAIIQQWR